MNTTKREWERTGFQEHAPYHPSIDLQTDFVMVYGIDSTMPERVKKWKDAGYVVHLMTGVAWGEYEEYLNGRFDGRSHWDEAQKQSDGSEILHGKDIPYMVPTVAFSDYLTEKIKIAVDVGVEAIHLEEPEFWVNGGYSEAFKREWEIFYGETWMPPEESVEAQFRASKLKNYLYTRCLERLCSSLKEYAKVKYDRNLRFYVPTHSLVNYSQWRIVSPESKLMDVPTIDGYIAQIWTGTSRTPNIYEGVRSERTFETAFLEYGIMQELVRGTNRSMWFLHDPIEDNPDYTWKDYRENYFKTLIASLLHPGVSRYEVVPWPNRVFNGKYPKVDGSEKESIPQDYAATLLVIMNSLRDMEQEDIRWAQDNLTVGLLLSDSAMFQRYYPCKYEVKPEENIEECSSEGKDGYISQQDMTSWSAFYGMALPLLKYGIAVRPVQLDNVRRFPKYLDDYRILVLSYEFIKPEYPDIHNAISQWVAEGGILVYIGDDSDPYHEIRAWWNQGKKKYISPRQHLFECMGIKSVGQKDDIQSIYKVNMGVLAHINIKPFDLSHSKENANILRNTVSEAIKQLGDPTITWNCKNSFVLHRGPYVAAAVMHESVNDNSTILKGSFIDLLDSTLAVRNVIKVKPGGNALLYNLGYGDRGNKSKLIASSARIDEFVITEDLTNPVGIKINLTAKGPENIKGVTRILCAQKPEKVEAFSGGRPVDITLEWDAETNTVLLSYINKPEGIKITLT